MTSLVSAIGWLSLTATTALGAPQYPNLIYILVDDLGWANVNMTVHDQYHNPRMMTPTLDSLLPEALVLNQYYVYKYCSPTRSAFLSGRMLSVCTLSSSSLH